MKKIFITLLLLYGAACAPATAVQNKAEINPGFVSIDILANLPEPNCESGLTPANQEGPYYKADSPERTSLIDADTQGKRLILSGYVLTSDCYTVPHAWLDFWEANADGEYDNDGYTLRGHQFSDNKGRYYLETIMPGLYNARPIEHIHVKVKIMEGAVFTTQLYFPAQPFDGLTINLQEGEGVLIGYFNFVLK